MVKIAWRGKIFKEHAKVLENVLELSKITKMELILHYVDEMLCAVLYLQLIANMVIASASRVS